MIYLFIYIQSIINLLTLKKNITNVKRLLTPRRFACRLLPISLFATIVCSIRVLLVCICSLIVVSGHFEFELLPKVSSNGLKFNMFFFTFLWKN